MDPITPFIAYAAALAVAAVIPGPGVAALVGQSLGGNARASMGFLLGISLGDVTYLTIAVVGLAAIANTLSWAVLGIKVLGGGYLLYMAYKFWTTDAEATAVKTRKDKDGVAALLSGYLVTIGNPKAIVFYLALAPSVVDMNAVTIADWLILATISVTVLFAVLTPYVVLSVRARAMMSRPSTLARLNRFAGTMIGGAGALILGEVVVGLLRRS